MPEGALSPANDGRVIGEGEGVAEGAVVAVGVGVDDAVGERVGDVAVGWFEQAVRNRTTTSSSRMVFSVSSLAVLGV
ncbi:MAG: hypothetical protein E6H91_02615 [Chloroflexi bacterium]|nr:MAG: hypothetical protein E6H91_02615 [Chloroflexota bacterium]